MRRMMVRSVNSNIVNPNLFTNSNNFEDWDNSGLTITPNAAISPDGTLNASEIEYSNNVRIRSNAIQITSGEVYTFSLFAKQSSGFNVALTNRSVANLSVLFDISDITFIGEGNFFVAASIINVGNGWFRLIINILSTSTEFREWDIRMKDGDGSVFIYGAKFEIGNKATKYEL